MSFFPFLSVFSMMATLKEHMGLRWRDDLRDPEMLHYFFFFLIIIILVAQTVHLIQKDVLCMLLAWIPS